MSLTLDPKKLSDQDSDLQQLKEDLGKTAQVQCTAHVADTVYCLCCTEPQLERQRMN